MNKKDIERMMSLVDDRYVNELFSDNIQMSKRRPYAVFAGCAAAVAAVILGINILVNNISESENITDLNQIRTEITVTESAFPYSGINGDEETDYGQYFKSEKFSWSASFNSSEIGGRTYTIDGDYLEELVPFADFFENGFGNASITCDSTGKPVKGFVSYRDLSLKHNIYMTMSSKERIADDIESKPVKRHGIDVYGCDDYSYDPLTETNPLIGRLLYFHINETDYMIRFSTDFSYEEAVKLMDTVIERGITPEDFDVATGWINTSSNGNLSLEEANKLEFFKGYVPQTETVDFGNGAECVLNVNYGDTYNGETLVSQWLDINYREYSDNIGDYFERPYIGLYYTSDKSTIKASYSIPFKDLNREMFDSGLQVYKKSDGTESYFCIIEAENFYLDIQANASPDLIWSVLESIPANVLE